MANFYNQISENKLRSRLIIFSFIGFIFLSSYLISYALDLGPYFNLFALFLASGSSLVSYFGGSKIVLLLNNAKPAKREEFFDFYTATENLSLANQIPMPQIYVIDSPSPNAFATGTSPQKAIICATTGLLQKLNRTEIEAVIAHELSHIKNYDTRLMTLVSILLGSLSLLINFSYDSGRNRDKNKSYFLQLIGFLLIIFAPFIGRLIQFSISRSREYLADSEAVKLTRQPQGLISALQKISTDSDILQTASPATANLYIDNPFKGNKVAELFSTHPPIQKRIEALQKMM